MRVALARYRGLGPQTDTLVAMYRITFESDAFNGVQDADESLEYLAAALDMLIAWDTIYLLRHPNAPLLYQSGVRYEEEPIGAEFWRDIPTVLKYGSADCEDLSAWLIAEKRVRFGVPARPLIIPQLRPNGKYPYHIAVASPDARNGVLDPSKDLGMVASA